MLPCKCILDTEDKNVSGLPSLLFTSLCCVILIHPCQLSVLWGDHIRATTHPGCFFKCLLYWTVRGKVSIRHRTQNFSYYWEGKKGFKWMFSPI